MSGPPAAPHGPGWVPLGRGHPFLVRRRSGIVKVAPEREVTQFAMADNANPGTDASLRLTRARHSEPFALLRTGSAKNLLFGPN